MKKKWLGILGALILMLTIFTAVFYIAAESDHHCTGADCPICQVLHTAQGLIASTGRTIIKSHAAVQLPMQLLDGLTIIFVLKDQFLCEDTLVSKKIRFNN